jgi:hypothetical protein
VCGPGDWRLNLMTDEVEYTVTTPAGEEKKTLASEDYTQLRENLEQVLTDEGKRLKFAELEVRLAARSIAKRNAYSPVVDYLEGLQHDGTDRLPGLAKALGLDERTQGLEVTFLHRWLIAAVARAYRPGCQVDTVLVLQGSEGQFKSRLFEDLGGAWFVRMSAELGTRDAVETMRRAWIVELDELDAIKRSREFSTVKAAITRPDDDYVPKWIRESQKVKRRSVLGGTVNDVEHLGDEEGLRRFWVVAVRQRIDRRWVAGEPRPALGSGVARTSRAASSGTSRPRKRCSSASTCSSSSRSTPGRSSSTTYLFEQRPVELFEQPVTVQEVYSKVLAELAPKDQTLGNRKTVTRCLRRAGFVPGVRGTDRKRGWWKHDRPPG